jgi:hypothetical protein
MIFAWREHCGLLWCFDFKGSPRKLPRRWYPPFAGFIALSDAFPAETESFDSGDFSAPATAPKAA